MFPYIFCLFLCIFQKYVSELSVVRDCVESCVEKGKFFLLFSCIVVTNITIYELMIYIKIKHLSHYSSSKVCCSFTDTFCVSKSWKDETGYVVIFWKCSFFMVLKVSYLIRLIFILYVWLHSTCAFFVSYE